MNANLDSEWVVGFVTNSEPLPAGAIRLTLDNGRIGIIKNPHDISLSYLLEPSKQDGLYNRGVAFKTNAQNIVMEIKEARVRVGIVVRWLQNSRSLVLAYYGRYGSEAQKQLIHQEDYLAVGSLPTPTDYELHPTLHEFAKFSRIAEDAAARVENFKVVKYGKPVDIIFGDHPSEIIHIQYSLSALTGKPHYLTNSVNQ